VGKVFFPLDEELRLLPGALAPRQQEHLVRLACFMPFAKATQMMQELLWVQTDEETARRLTERMGACIQGAQSAPEAWCSQEPTEQPAPQRRVLPCGWGDGFSGPQTMGRNVYGRHW
jgi:hypothetical protein